MVGVSYFGSHVFLSTGASLVVGGLGFLSGLLAARLLGPVGRGELAAIQAWPFLLTTVASLGLHEATIYFSARAPSRASRYLASSALLAVVAAVPVVMLGYIMMPLLLHAQAPDIIGAARWYLLAVPVAALVAMPLGALRGCRDLLTWNLLRLATPAGWVVILCIATLSGHRRPEWVAAAFLLMSAALVAVFWSVASGRLEGPIRPDRRDWPALLRYGLPTMASQTPMMLNLRFDQMAMAAFLAPKVLGLYAVAVAWSGALGPVLSGVGVVVFPMVASHTDAADQASVLARGTRLGALLALSTGGLLVLLAPVAIPGLFGSAFAPAVPAALILVLAGGISEINGILRDGARGLGQTGAVLISEVFGVAVGILTLAVLIRPLGIVGAAIASVTGYSAATFWLVRTVQRATHSSIGMLFRPRLDDIRAAWIQVRAFTGS